MSNEEKLLHHDITWAEYLALSEEKRASNEIYFITDLSNDKQLLNTLIEEVRLLREKLEQIKEED